MARLLTDMDYKAFERNRPHIDRGSFEKAFFELVDSDLVKNGSFNLSSVMIAAAIHEFSNMMNEHIAQAYRCCLEKERGDLDG